MLTPQEIQDKKFEKAVFGGYDMGQIDQFLDQLLDDYTSLYKENATLKAKMRVLVDKIEEYRAVDEEMRKALYSAQIASRDMVSKAQAEAEEVRKISRQEAEKLLGEARQTAERKVASLRQQIDFEEQKLKEAKLAASQYGLVIREALLGHADQIAQIIERPFVAPAAPEKPKASGSDALADIENAVSQQLGPAEQPPVKQEAPVETRQPVAAVVAEQAPVQPAAAPAVESPVKPIETVELNGMETTFYEIKLGGDSPREQVSPNAGGKEQESDTAKIYGDSIFTPKPRFNFTDLRFGANYHSEEDEGVKK